MSKRLGIMGEALRRSRSFRTARTGWKDSICSRSLLQFAAMLLFIWAGVTGSRWWLAGGVAYAGYFGFFLWVLSRGH